MPRRKPFSGKQKKQQLQEKRQAQAGRAGGSAGASSSRFGGPGETPRSAEEAARDAAPRKDGERCFLRFINDSNDTVAELRALGRQPFSPSPLFQVDQAVYMAPNCCPDLPRRPPGVREMSREELQAAEAKAFEEYFRAISPDMQTVSREYCAFEVNEEVYREVWRVSERSDVLCVVTDARFPLAHAPISILRYARFEAKPVILVLNKSDLVPPEVLEDWCGFMEAYLERVFAEYAVPAGAGAATDSKAEASDKPARRFVVMSVCARHIEKSAGDRLEFVSAFVRAARELAGIPAPRTVTIGFYGQPSVGKSSLMNGIYGKRIVSVKRTPGHTKHLQTYYLDPEALRAKADAESAEKAADPTLSARQARLEAEYLTGALSPEADGGDAGAGESKTLETGDVYTSDGRPGGDAEGDREDLGEGEEEDEGEGEGEDENEDPSEQEDSECKGRADIEDNDNDNTEGKAEEELGNKKGIVNDSPDSHTTGRTSDTAPSTPLGEETRRSVLLCDCPGLVFPVRWSPRPLQVITGVFPLGRTREFVSPLRLLCESVPGLRQRLLGELERANLPARFPGARGKTGESPLEILELFGYYWGFEAKSGPDVQRAGVSLFKRIVDGRVGYHVVPDPSLLSRACKDLEEAPSYWKGQGGSAEGGVSAGPPVDTATAQPDVASTKKEEEKLVEDGEPRCGWW